MNLAVKRAVQELSQGNLVLLKDLKGQANLVSLADKTTPDMVNFMIKHGKGLVSVGIEESRAQQLDMKLQQQSHYSSNETQAFTVSVDIEETTTGISAFERYQTIAALTDPSRKPEEFKRPGHIFPVISHQKGLFGNQTHTELGIELAKQTDAYPAVVLCEVLNESGQLASEEEVKLLAMRFELFILKAEDVIQDFITREKVVKQEGQKEVSNHIGDFKIIAYSNELDSNIDYVFYSEPIDKRPIPVYIHRQCSQCHIMACDCHHEFERALSYVKNMGGICLQMSNRNNNTGLIRTLKQYGTTVLAAKMLKDLGIKEMECINKEPMKETLFQDFGFTLEGGSLEERAI